MNFMRQRASVISAGLCLSWLSLAAANAQPPMSTSQKLAVHAASSWLTLIDSGKYGQSWDASAPVFEKSVARTNWVSQVQVARKTLGKMKARVIRAVRNETVPAGAPPGEAIGVQFTTSYSKRTPTIETLHLIHTSAGAWKVTGYSIK